MELDGFIPGNWDFSYGKNQLKHLVDKLPFPTLVCNVNDADTGSPFFSPYMIKEMTGLKVGVIGLTYGYKEEIMPASFTGGLSFSLGAKEVEQIVREIQRDVDLIIIVSHLGLPLDVKLASQVEGIDVILSGHSHDRVTRPIDANGTIVVQVGSNSAFLGQLNLTVDSKKIVDFDYQLIDVHEHLEEDPIVEELVRGILQPYDGDMTDIVGATDTILHRMTLNQSPMDTLITDAYLHADDVDIALSQGWRYDSPVVEDPITMYDLHSIIPTNPKSRYFLN